MALDRSPTRQQVTTDDGAVLDIWSDPSAGQSLAQMFWRRVRERGEAEALRQQDGEGWHSISWAELGLRVRAIGLGLKSLGFGRHDVAAIVAAPGADWLAAEMAVFGVAGAVIALDPDMDAATVEAVVRQVGAKLVFTDCTARLAGVEHVVAADDLEGLKAAGEVYDREHLGQWEQLVDLARPKETAALVCGADGRIAQLGHKALVFQCVNASRWLAMSDGDVRVAAAPMSDLAERVVGGYAALYAGVVIAYPATGGKGADLVPTWRLPRLICRPEGCGPVALAGDAGVEPAPYGELHEAAGGTLELRGEHVFNGYRDAPAPEGWVRTQGIE